MRASVTVRVAGSTSNLGAGFDCVGVAVGRWLQVTAQATGGGKPVVIERGGTLRTLDTAPEADLLYRGFAAACRRAGREVPGGLALAADSDIPVARGLGSSAAATVAGAAAAAALLDLALDATGLVELCSELEGHPDNVAPAVFGGANLVLRGPDGLIVTPLPIHQSLALVFAVPDFTVETKRARAALPATLPHADAVRAAAKSAALVHGLAHGDARLLAAGLDDVLHVPFRRALVPGYDEVTGAARQAGAYGATLSGSGPTIVAVVGADPRHHRPDVSRHPPRRRLRDRLMARAPRSPPHIHKFGGASLANAAGIAHAAKIVVGHRPAPQVVVVSAMSGVTDALLDCAARASRGDAAQVRAAAKTLRARHAEAVRALVPRGARLDELGGIIDAAFAELEQLAGGLGSLREINPRTIDYLVARGERLSAQMFAAALEAAGCPAVYVDATEVVQTDGTFGNASPDLGGTQHHARRALGPVLARGAVPVVPGFLGAAPDGQVATLGRGGSDLTATLLARVLGARDVSLWKDVPGLLTADPRIVPDARVVPQVHLREAAELAYYGAKVLHPRSLVPVMKQNVAIRIRPFADPASLGTEISRRRTLEQYPVKALSAIPKQALLTVTGSGMLGVPGIAARTFAAVHHEGISVSLITQASSEHSICFSVPEESAQRARRSLEQTFQREIARQEIDGVEARTGLATLVVVGLGMAETPGIAARVFSALAEAGINVIATAQGSSELNLSLVVDGKEAPRAQRLVHAAFQLSKIGGGAVAHPERSDVVLLGFGQIGRALAPMIAKVKREALTLRIVGLIDSSGFVFDADGFSPRRLAALGAAKAKGAPLAKATGGRRASAAEAVAFVARHALSNPILVDLTADETTDTLTTALGAGMHVVLANKRPVTTDKRQYDALRAAAQAHGRRLLLEATVGAGLPIIDTYQKLVESGDRVSKIEGCPSGTLGYLFGELGRGAAFSTALEGAIAKGYPEPDPREDLSGMDVARKALILGRLLGFPGELDDIAVESLVPDGAGRLKLDRFLASLEQFDAAWAKRVAAARARGGVLRYRAIVTRKSIRVGLVVVDASSPMASLNGTDNQFIFTTMRYKKNPLVITGPGAGPAVTAGGILNDVLKLAGA